MEQKQRKGVGRVMGGSPGKCFIISAPFPALHVNYCIIISAYNQYKLLMMFLYCFLPTKSLKSGVYLTPAAHLSAD